VQAQRQVERLGGGPERLVLGLVVTPVPERIFGEHHAGIGAMLPFVMVDV
jgi:hypothetical protein